MSQSGPDDRLPRTGFSLRREYDEPLRRAQHRPPVLELMVESFLAKLPARLEDLAWLRREHELTAHSVSLSIGSVDRPPPAYFDGVARFLELTEPTCYSDHLALTFSDGRELGQLTPLRYDEPTLEVVIANLEAARKIFGIMPCLEIIAEPFTIPGSRWTQAEFAAELHRATGCGLHADVTNIHINSVNFGEDARAFIDALPAAAVRSVHVVGYGTHADGELVDSHDDDAPFEVLELLRHLLRRARPETVIIERDGRLPDYATMMAEVERVRAVVKASVASDVASDVASEARAVGAAPAP